MERRGRQGLKKCILLITIILFLSGCSNSNNEINSPIGPSSMEESTNSISIIVEESVEEEHSIKEIISNGSPGLRFDSHGDGTCTVRRASCTDSDIIIPTYSPDGDKVTVVGDSAWKDKCINSIVIPEGVEIIEKCAFFNCPVRVIYLPSTLKEIEYSAFGDPYPTEPLEVHFNGSRAQWNNIYFWNYNRRIKELADVKFVK